MYRRGLFSNPPPSKRILLANLIVVAGLGLCAVSLLFRHSTPSNDSLVAHVSRGNERLGVQIRHTDGQPTEALIINYLPNQQRYQLFRGLMASPYENVGSSTTRLLTQSEAEELSSFRAQWCTLNPFPGSATADAQHRYEIVVRCGNPENYAIAPPRWLSDVELPMYIQILLQDDTDSQDSYVRLMLS